MNKRIRNNWDRIEDEFRKINWEDILYEDMPKLFQFAREMFAAEHPDGITVRDNVKS